jgi:ubiquinone biosynthesis protein COQ4
MAALPQLKLIAAYARPPPLYDGHVPLSGVEKTLLAFGSAFMSLYNPWRGGIICFLPD